jgi:hypothetical protein
VNVGVGGAFIAKDKRSSDMIRFFEISQLFQ